jgi:hypothetical protein
MKELTLSRSQAASAAAIQEAIDSLGAEGGRVTLPEMELTLDRGLELRSGVELVGQGKKTVLRKARGRVYPLSGYHNYGMCDAPLQFTDGLEVGMTVAIRDNTHGGFFETLARVAWIEGNWVGLDHGVESDYAANQNPILVTAHPLVFGQNVQRVAVRDLTLDGNREAQPAGIGACRGAAVYFIRSGQIEVTNVEESGFLGEGLGFQMCHHVTIRGCHFARNSGNGFHPGAGSTAALFEDCTSENNDAAGFYFCVRANHITVRNCAFIGNDVCGLSIGTRDCYNLIERCEMRANAGPGILVRPVARPTEVHSCQIADCRVAHNAFRSGQGQIEIQGDAHDLILERNQIEGLRDQEKAGIYVTPAAERVLLRENQMRDCFPDVIASRSSLTLIPSPIFPGIEAAQEMHFRHLPRE